MQNRLWSVGNYASAWGLVQRGKLWAYCRKCIGQDLDAEVNKSYYVSWGINVHVWESCWDHVVNISQMENVETRICTSFTTPVCLCLFCSVPSLVSSVCISWGVYNMTECRKGIHGDYRVHWTLVRKVAGGGVKARAVRPFLEPPPTPRGGVSRWTKVRCVLPTLSQGQKVMRKVEKLCGKCPFNFQASGFVYLLSTLVHTFIRVFLVFLYVHTRIYRIDVCTFILITFSFDKIFQG